MFGDMDRGTIHHASQLAEHYQTMLLCFSLLLLYLVPFCVFVRYTRMRAGVPRWLVVLAFASGLFIPGWIAGELNDAADVLLRAATSKAFVSTWGDAVEAPLVEETLKLLTVLAVLGLAGRHGGRDWLVGGMCVGMGFQLNEDLSYIVDQVASAHHGYETAVAVTLGDRVSGALVSHWTYTALAAVAVWLFFCQRRRLRGLLLVLAPLLSHAAASRFWRSRSPSCWHTAFSSWASSPGSTPRAAGACTWDIRLLLACWPRRSWWRSQSWASFFSPGGTRAGMRRKRAGARSCKSWARALWSWLSRALRLLSRSGRSSRRTERSASSCAVCDLILPTGVRMTTSRSTRRKAMVRA